MSVGRTPGIEKVGTRIYQSAFFMFKTEPNMNYIGAYVMDNLLTARNVANGNTLMTLSEYYKKHYKSSTTCPKDMVTGMYTKLLFDFYKITGGWHVDLHARNIQVILGPDGVPKKMVVIDYGSHVPFKNKNRINRARCPDDILDSIEENFSRIKSKPQIYWSKNAPHKASETVGRGQLAASNANVLRKTNFQPLYASSRLRSHTKRKRNMMSPPKVPSPRKSPPKVPSPRKSPSRQPTPRGAIRTNKKTPRGRAIFKGVNGGKFVIGPNGKKNYRRVISVERP